MQDRSFSKIILNIEEVKATTSKSHATARTQHPDTAPRWLEVASRLMPPPHIDFKKFCLLLLAIGWLSFKIFQSFQLPPCAFEVATPSCFLRLMFLKLWHLVTTCRLIVQNCHWFQMPSCASSCKGRWQHNDLHWIFILIDLLLL